MRIREYATAMAACVYRTNERLDSKAGELSDGECRRYLRGDPLEKRAIRENADRTDFPWMRYLDLLTAHGEKSRNSPTIVVIPEGR
jgi:hypothetical protein